MDSMFCQFLVFQLILIFNMGIGVSSDESSLPTLPSQSTPDFSTKMKRAREILLKTIQKETFQLSGFDEYDTIPITYPIDICLMEIDSMLYAACLGIEVFPERNATILKIFKKIPPNPLNASSNYDLIYSSETNSAHNMDCVSIENVGFIAIVNDIQSLQYNDISQGSPVFRLHADQVAVVQYFAEPQQHSIQLQRAQNTLFLVQTFRNNAVHQKQWCPIYKWVDSTFNQFDSLPCTDAMRIEPFIIDEQVFVAIANHMDENNNKETYSPIYKYDLHEHKFHLVQNIKTYGAIDVKHFQLFNKKNATEKFLIVANTFDVRREHGANLSTASNAVIYCYEHGHFVPVQILNFDAEIKQFLPVLTENNKFVLLISLKEQSTKTYQYNGWKFVETPITFTGGSLGKGVSKMRTYKPNREQIVIVVANVEMLRDATNLFRPKFTVKMELDFGKAIDMFDTWHAIVKQKLHSDHISELSTQLEVLQPPSSFAVLNLDHTKVNVIRTDLLTSASIPIDMVQLKKSLTEANEILSHEYTSIVRRPKRLNDSELNVSLPLNEQEHNETHPAIELTANELTVSDDFYVEYINGHHISDLLCADSDLSLDRFEVDHLVIVNNTQNFKEIEGKLQNATQRSKRDASDDERPLVVNELTVEGKVNGIDLRYLIENALRTNDEQQRIEAPWSFDVLRSSSVQTANNQLSGKNFSDIVQIRADMTLIDTNMRFTQPLLVNKFNVLSRFNHIRIVDGSMDALFRRHRGVQVITGQKVFESVKLLEPIKLQGNIKILSPIMEKIKPIVTVNEDVEINGDFVITGNVTVQRLLKAHNIFGKSALYSVDRLLEDGLRSSAATIDVPMEFTQPIRVENIAASTRLNDISVESLIKRNVSDIQIIFGRKTFTGDLHIKNGICDAQVINDIDLQTLNNTILKKSGANQIITGSIQFKRIIAENVNSGKIFFGRTSIDRLLTKYTDQVINGNVTIHGSILLTNSTGLEINHLSNRNHVFGIDLNELLADSIQYRQNESIQLLTNKWFRNISIGHLIIEGDFWQLETTDQIENRLRSLHEGILLNGPVTFSNRFNIDELTVADAINGIPSARFGREWLLMEGEQTFTAPQTFTSIVFEEHIQLAGHINGYDIQRLVYDTIGRNTQQPVSLKNVAFENVIFEKSLQLNGKLSGIRIPDDLILRQSNALQNIIENINFASNVRVYGGLFIVDTLNGLSYSRMCNLVEAPQGFDNRLIVNGDVYAINDPIVTYLNMEPFSQILSTAWFVDESEANFTAGLEFANAIFHKNVLTGLINGHDLEQLSKRYLSLTKPQQIHTTIRFQNSVQFKHSLQTGSVTLRGQLKAYESDIGLDIVQFNENVLKHIAGTQVIRGFWSLQNVQVLGNLDNISINNLKLSEDVVRWSQSQRNVICADKHFAALDIDRLICEYGCSIQGINISDWISKAVFPSSNYTIQGVVYIQDPVISHITALGTVNNLTPFNKQTILLKREPQKIYGNVYIGNRATSGVSSLTFDNIYLNFFNGHNFTAFYDNLIKRGPRNGEIVANVFSKLKFLEPIVVANLRAGSLNGVNLSTLTPLEHNRFDGQYRMATSELESMAYELSARQQLKRFDRMVVRPALRGIEKLYKIRDFDELGVDFVALSNINGNGTKRVMLYRWDDQSKQLLLIDDGTHMALPTYTIIIDLFVVSVDFSDLIIIQMQNTQHNSSGSQFTQSFYRIIDKRIQSIHKMHTNASIEIVAFVAEQQSCFVSYRQQHAREFDLFCMEINETNPMELHVNRLDSVKTSEINEILTSSMSTVIIRDVAGNIELQDYDLSNKQARSARRMFSNLSDVAVRDFGNITYVVVCINAKLMTDGHSVDHGIINIFRYSKGKLEPIQSLNIRHEAIVQCDFTQFSADSELILIVLSSSTTLSALSPLASLSFYKLKGLTGFQLMPNQKIRLNSVHPNDESATIVANAISKLRFSVIESKAKGDAGKLEFIAIYSPHEMGIIECVYQ